MNVSHFWNECDAFYSGMNHVTAGVAQSLGTYRDQMRKQLCRKQIHTRVCQQLLKGA